MYQHHRFFTQSIKSNHLLYTVNSKQLSTQYLINEQAEGCNNKDALYNL